MKDINSVMLSGIIFWSKLDDRQSFSILRTGVSLPESGPVFVSISNPQEKAYEKIKPGNKILVSNSWLDIWEKNTGESELLLKAYGTGVDFFPKEKALPEINEVTILGTIKNYIDGLADIELVGDRNPKTGKFAIRKAVINIGNTYQKDIIGDKIFLKGKVSSAEKEGKKTILVIEPYYDKINIFRR